MPKDTDNNAVDFLFVDTNGTSAGAGQRLGSPGPEKSTSPLGDTGLAVGLLDPSVAATATPNLVRDLTSDPAHNSTFGTVTIRRTITNSTAAPLTTLRFRISELSTFPSPSGVADLRPITSTSSTVTVNGVVTTVLGTTLEQPPNQPNGGGFNTTMGVALDTPLETGASVAIQIRLGIQQTGKFRLCGNLQSLPSAGGALGQVGNTDTGPTPAPCQRTQPFPAFNMTAPTVTASGTPKQGSTLSSDIGTWSGTGLIVYGTQWRRCDTTCTDIPGASATSYTAAAADVGKTLRVRVMAASVGGLVGAESAPTATVIEGVAPALTASTDGAVKAGVLTVTLTCPSSETSCAGTVGFTATVKGAVVDLGTGTFSMLGGASQALPIQLSKRGRALTRKRKLTATMTVEVTDAAGNATTLEQTVTLKKSKK